VAGAIAITAFLISKAKNNKKPVKIQQMQAEKSAAQNMSLNINLNALPNIYNDFKSK